MALVREPCGMGDTRQRAIRRIELFPNVVDPHPAQVFAHGNAVHLAEGRCELGTVHLEEPAEVGKGERVGASLQSFIRKRLA